MSSSKARFFNPAVVGLIMLSFFLGTSEYTVIGILPEIADGFGISLTQAGSIVSLFAFAYGLGTPFLAAYVGKYNRFRITMLGISLFALCNLICAIATNYMVFLVFRILTAVVSGTVVSISMTYAEDVASIPEHIPGVIASTITHVFGWRAAFITIFVATLALLALLFMKLPRQNRLKAGSILEQFKLFLDKRISIGCAIVFLAGASTYCFYTYLTPIFQQELHIPDSMLSLALLIFGIAAGSAMGGVIVKYAGLRFVGIGGAIPGIGAIICAVILLQIMKPGADIR